MGRYGKRIAGVVAALALALVGLCGCGLFEPQSAKDVLLRYVQAANRDNYSFDARITIKPSVFGQTLEIPLNIAGEVAGDRSHMTTTTELFGQKTSQESYVEKDGDTSVQYTSMTLGDETQWYRSTTQPSDFVGKAGDSLANSGILDNATFAKSENGYQITIAGKDVTELMRGLGGGAGSAGGMVDLGQLVDAAEAGDVTLGFTKDCLPKSAKLSLRMAAADGAASTDDSQSDAGLDLLSAFADFGMDVEVSFDGYGSVEEASVTVPGDVREGASDLDAIADDAAADSTGAADAADNKAA